MTDTHTEKLVHPESEGADHLYRERELIVADGIGDWIERVARG